MLPGVLPTDALLVGMVVFLVAVLVMNRNRMRMVNVVFEREAAVMGVAAVILAGNQWLSDVSGLNPQTVIVVGVVVALGALYSWQR